MAPKFSNSQKEELKRKGYTDQMIREMEAGTYMGGTGKKDYQNYTNVFGDAFKKINDVGNAVASKVSSTSSPASYFQPQAFVPGIQPSMAIQNKTPAPTGVQNFITASQNRKTNPAPKPKKSAGLFDGVFSSLNNTVNTIAERFKNGDFANQEQELGGFEMPDYQGGGGDYPSFDVQVPVIERRDFTDQARQNVDSAFAPLFAEFERQKSGTAERGERNRQILSGLYDDYTKDIATNAAATQQRHDAQVQDRSKQGDDLAQRIAGYYQSANQNTADTLSGIGAQAAAPTVLQEGANDQAYQQTQAAQNTQANNDYVNAQASGDAQAAVRSGQIAQNQGLLAQKDSLADVAAALSQIDSQIAGQRASNAQTALSMANELSSQDMSMQQANAGYSMQGQQMQQQNALGAYEAQQAAADRQYQVGMDRYNAQRQQQQDQLGQYRWETEMNNQTKQQNYENQLGIAKLQAGSDQAGAGLAPNEYTGLGKLAAQTASQLPDQGNQLFNDVATAARNTTAVSDPSDPATYQQYMKTFQNIKAKHPQLGDGQILQVMQQYWTTAFKG